MRLLNAKSLELREFPNHEDVPYAILSHTWAEEEILFRDIEGRTAESIPDQVKQKFGYKKLEACCAQAIHDGLEYVWIDTCCIDKRSSAELSEAINSMYRWYSDCIVCYAYLADVPNNADFDIRIQKFKESRWFTRGWTLQELIAPQIVEFYGDQWHSKGQNASLGTKYSLKNELSEISRIPINGLTISSIFHYSVAQRMSWAANRETTRKEDRAYCLIGLFNINMPLLYGEGDRAFIRLQEEILKTSTDETLFAWTTDKNPGPFRNHGLLAMSPDCFLNSSSFNEYYDKGKPFFVTNKGLQLETLLHDASNITEATDFKKPALVTTVHVAILNCTETLPGHWKRNIIGVLLTSRRPTSRFSEFVRVDGKVLVRIPEENFFIKYYQAYTPITVRLAEIYTPNALTQNIEDGYSRIEEKHRIVLIRETPPDFLLVQAWPRELSVHPDNSAISASFEISESWFDRAAALRFDNGVDAFVVGFGSRFNKPWIIIRHQTVGEALKEEFHPEKPIVPKETPDRDTYELLSRRVVFASLRREFTKGLPCYAVYISVST